MDVERLERRNTSLDILRICAVFLVNSVHFFWFNGFYQQTLRNDSAIFIMMIMRTFFTICVPLFMILTGYLMSQKTLSKSYYKGIRKTLIIYAIATLACMIYKTITANEPISVGKVILDFLSFKGANYSWYIEFYIGLFLIAPFLNLMYNGLKTQRKKQILVFTFFAISILPNIFNMHVFTNPQWWATPTISSEYDKILPSWWTCIYPVSFYFVGAYLREYGFKMKTRTLLIGYPIVLLIFTLFNFYRYFGTTFNYSTVAGWGSFEAYVLSCGFFILITRIPTAKIPIAVKWGLWKVSDLALGMYLISFIFDQTFYTEFLNKYVTVFTDKLPWYLVIVPCVFVFSMAASLLMNYLAKGIIIAYEAVVRFVKKIRESDSKDKYRDFLFLFLMAGAVCFAVWKCFYGFGGDDEAFYLTIPKRLIQGDALFTQEWHLSQMSSIFLVPFVGAYRLITGSYDGIILAARFFYVIGHAAVACFVYSRLRKYGYIVLFASLFFFIYTPYNIMAYSYNTLSVDFVVLTGVIMGTASFNKKLPIIFGGICFAAAVLCSPYIAVGYALYIICVVLHKAFEKKEFKSALKSDLFSLKTCLWFTVGIAVMTVIFLAFVFSRTGINEFMSALPKLFDDPEHPQISFLDKIWRYFNSSITFHSHYLFALIPYAVMMLVMIFDTKRKLHRGIYLSITAALVIMVLIMLLPTMTVSSYNAIMYPMLFIGITSYALCNEKPRELFVSLFCLGILYSFAVCMASNQYFYVISMAMCTANVASFVFLSQLVKEMRETDDNLDYAKFCKYFAFSLVALMITLQGFFQIEVKARHCFFEPAEAAALTSKIEQGPAKGINTNSTKAAQYNNLYNDLQYYKGKTPANILSVSGTTWIYLELNDYPYATYSAWIGGEGLVSIDTVSARLNDFYNLNPSKYPKYVYIPKETKWTVSRIVEDFKNRGFTVTENNMSYKLEK